MSQQNSGKQEQLFSRKPICPSGQTLGHLDQVQAGAVAVDSAEMRSRSIVTHADLLPDPVHLFQQISVQEPSEQKPTVRSYVRLL